MLRSINQLSSIPLISRFRLTITKIIPIINYSKRYIATEIQQTITTETVGTKIKQSVTTKTKQSKFNEYQLNSDTFSKFHELIKKRDMTKDTLITINHYGGSFYDHLWLARYLLHNKQNKRFIAKIEKAYSGGASIMLTCDEIQCTPESKITPCDIMGTLNSFAISKNNTPINNTQDKINNDNNDNNNNNNNNGASAYIRLQNSNIYDYYSKHNVTSLREYNYKLTSAKIIHAQNIFFKELVNHHKWNNKTAKNVYKAFFDGKIFEHDFYFLPQDLIKFGLPIKIIKK